MNTLPKNGKRSDRLRLESGLSTETDRERILTIREVAAELQCSTGHVSNLINGKIPGAPPLHHARIGRRVLVKEAWLHAFLESAKE